MCGYQTHAVSASEMIYIVGWGVKLYSLTHCSMDTYTGWPKK